MSHEAQTWVLKYSTHKGGPLLLLYVIANHAHPDGTSAYASERTLAQETRLTERQVRRIIAEKLLPSGELEIEGEAGKFGIHGFRLPHVQGFLAPRKAASRKGKGGQNAPPTGGKDVPPEKMSGETPEMSPGQDDRGGHFAQGGGHFEHEGGDISTNLPDISTTGAGADSGVPTGESGEKTAAQPMNPELREPKNPEERVVPLPALLPFPGEFFLRDEDLAWLEAECFPAAQWEHETQKFVSFMKAKGRTSADWYAEWRFWLLRSRDGPPRRDRRAS